MELAGAAHVLATGVAGVRAADDVRVRGLGRDGEELPPEVVARGAVLAQAIDRLVLRAQEHGSLRADVTWRDLVLISIAPIGGTECLGATRGEGQWRRTVAIALDGLRAPAASILPPE
ncbi:hypothetical protein [Streptomyces tauricus]|uniref:SbtR family transcriptional regulator n=1 Tax=Streptomyces tauricus TaxID=68274 RepID=UPI0033A37B8B